MRAAGVLLAAVVLCLVAELALRVLPSAKDLHRENPRAPASSARLLRSQPYTFSMGWDMRHVVRGRTNAMGFLSPHEYQPNARHALALIGDSFAEGEMLAYEESLAGHLESQSGGRLHPYNFGLSGAALPHYLGMAREMGSQFRFAAAVVVVVPGDYVEGFLEQEGVYKWGEGREVIRLVPAAQRSRLVQVARESALLHYVRENLKLSPATLFVRSKERACVPARLSPEDHERLIRYVDALPKALRLPPQKIVMVFNTNTRLIYERVDAGAAARPAPEPCADIDTLALTQLRALAIIRGMKLVEVGPLLENHYRTYRRPLDFRPVDAHWNGLATALIANEIGRQLSGERRAVSPTMAKLRLP